MSKYCDRERMARTTAGRSCFERSRLVRSCSTGSCVCICIGSRTAPNEKSCKKKPLGRVLIEHQVLREVELLELWQVFCGPVLSELFSVSQDTVTYGRTAMIHCNGEPAIELLEIVRPAPSISYP
jgi:hypothetical protein